MVVVYTDRLQTENKLLRAEVDSLTQQSRQQQQGLSQVQELATMLQERVCTTTNFAVYSSNYKFFFLSLVTMGRPVWVCAYQNAYM